MIETQKLYAISAAMKVIEGKAITVDDLELLMQFLTHNINVSAAPEQMAIARVNLIKTLRVWADNLDKG